MQKEQIEALLACAEALKDICNAADSGEAYLPGELLEFFGPLLNNLYASGILLSGEE